MTSRGRTVQQTSHRLMRDALRGFLCQAAQAGPGTKGIGCRASAALYTLLLNHTIDRQGRCRSCAMVGLRRCRIHITASYWLLLQPDAATLRSNLANELGLGTAPLPGTGSPPDRSLLTITARTDPRDTDVAPRIETEPCDPLIARHQTPAVPLPLPPRRFPRAGRPGPTHGGAREHPEH